VTGKNQDSFYERYLERFSSAWYAHCVRRAICLEHGTLKESTLNISWDTVVEIDIVTMKFRER
jgi:hypothetical protein